MARDANTSHAGVQSELETLETKAVWLQGLLNERERLHAEAEAKKDASERLLAQAGQDLREAKDFIKQLHAQQHHRNSICTESSTQTRPQEVPSPELEQGRESEAGSEFPRAQEAVDNLQQAFTETQQRCNQLQPPGQEQNQEIVKELPERDGQKINSGSGNILDGGLNLNLASMSPKQLQHLIQDLQKRLRQAEQQKQNICTKHLHGGAGENVGADKTSDLTSPRSQVAQLESKIMEMQVESKEREFTQSVELQMAQEMVIVSQEEKKTLHSEYLWLQASHEATVRELEKLKAAALSPPASPLLSPTVGWSKSQRPAGVFSDYSPHIPDVNEIAGLKSQVRNLSETLAETESTLQEGKRDMIHLLQVENE